MINRVTLLGYLGRDPESRKEGIANISLATTSKWTDKTTGEQKENTEWHRIVFFGRTADVVMQYLKKGARIYLEGRIQTKKYKDQNGVDKYSTEIIANQMQMLGSESPKTEAPKTEAPKKIDFDESDIPF